MGKFPFANVTPGYRTMILYTRSNRVWSVSDVLALLWVLFEKGVPRPSNEVCFDAWTETMRTCQNMIDVE